MGGLIRTASTIFPNGLYSVVGPGYRYKTRIATRATIRVTKRVVCGGLLGDYRRPRPPFPERQADKVAPQRT